MSTTKNINSDPYKVAVISAGHHLSYTSVDRQRFRDLLRNGETKLGMARYQAKSSSAKTSNNKISERSSNTTEERPSAQNHQRKQELNRSSDKTTKSPIACADAERNLSFLPTPLPFHELAETQSDVPRFLTSNKLLDLVTKTMEQMLAETIKTSSTSIELPSHTLGGATLHLVRQSSSQEQAQWRLSISNCDEAARHQLKEATPFLRKRFDQLKLGELLI